MRIAMVGCRGIPARCGGAERVVDELTRELSARGHEVLVYARGYYVAGLDPPAAGKRIITAGLAGKHLDTITHTATAMLDLSRRGADVVHIHSPGPALWSWVPALRGMPVVLTVHAPDWRRDKWSLPAKAIIRFGLACGMKLADAVTAVSAELARELSQRFSRDVAFVPNAVRPARLQRPDAIRRWSLPGGGYGLYVGRIVEEKRLDLLLRAWGKVGGTATLVVAGDAAGGAYGRRCRRIAPRNVLFVGPQHGKVLEELYSNATIVILPSALEGMSLVLLEAAAHGRCILASDIPANRQVMGEAALYHRRNSVSELADQIRRYFYNEELREAHGKKARRLVTSRYKWSNVADQMERIYVETMTGRIC